MGARGFVIVVRLLGSDAAVGLAAELPEPVRIGVSPGPVNVDLERPSDADCNKGVAASMGGVGGDMGEDVLTQGVFAQAAGSVFPVVTGEEAEVAGARLLHESVATTDRGKGRLECGDEGGGLLCLEAGSAGLFELVTIGDGDRHCGEEKKVVELVEGRVRQSVR